MTAEEFEQIALALKGTTRAPSSGQVAFARQRLFAVVRDAHTAHLRLSVEDQKRLTSEYPETFTVFNGRGPQGVTVVDLRRASRDVLERAIEMAWRDGGKTP